MPSQRSEVVQDILTRSKWVPTRIDPAVVDDPVKNPFGLHKYKSWPIRKLLLLFLPVVPPRSSLNWKEPIPRKVYGPTLYTMPGPCATCRPSPIEFPPVSNKVCRPPSP